MAKNSFKRSVESFKKNSISLIFISVFFCLVVGASFALDYILSGLSLAVILFLAVPMFFGAIVQSYALRYNPELKIRNYFKYSYSYYRPQFYGSFHLISSFLKALLIEVVVASIISSILYAVYSSNLGESFLDSFATLYSYIEAGMSDEAYLQEILELNGGALVEYFNLTFVISTCFGILGFIYFVSFNAIEAMFRSTIPPNMAAVGPRAFSTSVRMNKKVILKDFWALNWPLFVLAILGLVTGVLVSIFALDSYEYALLVGVFGLFVFIIPYFPFYLCNIHTIFENHQITVINGIQKSIAEMLARFLANPNLSEEQKNEATRIINDMMGENKEGDNKKDPESGS